MSAFRRRVLLLVYLLGLGAHLAAAAPPPPPAASDAAADFEKMYGVAPPPMIRLSTEEAAAQACERRGPFILAEIRYDPDQRGYSNYELLLYQARIRLLRQWAEDLSVHNINIADERLPNAVLLTSHPTSEAFQRDGSWYAAGILLFCAFSDSLVDEDLTADSESGPYPLDYDVDTDNFFYTPRIPFMSLFDTTQRQVGEELMEYVSAMDKFFANEQGYYDSTGSHIKITGDTVFEEGGELGFFGDARIRIGLPLTQKKLKLVFESDPEELVEGANRPLANSPGKAARERSYFAGLQLIFGDPDAWRFRPSVSVKIGSPADLLTRLRFSRDVPFVSWIMRFNQTFYWFDSIGLGEVSHVELDYQLLEDLLFRSSSIADWQDRKDYFDLIQSFELIHKLRARRAVSYGVSAFGVSEPSVFVTDYVLAVRYRQNIHSDYLFAELIPQVRFRKTNDFEDEHSLTLRLELLFRG